LIDLNTIDLPQEVLRLIPKDVALQFHVIPLSANNGSVRLAAPTDHDEQTLEDISFYLGKQVVAEEHPRGAILAALQRFYEVSEIDLAKSSLMQIETAGQKTHNEDTASADREERKKELAADGSVVATVDRLLTEAIRLGASDIHIEPYETFLRIRYRLDGVLHEVEELPLEKSKPIISRVKIMSELDISEKRRPQDGRIRVREDGRTIDIRVSSLPTDFGEKVVLRILDKSQLQLDLAKLGFEPEDLETFERTIRLPYGMILVTGPTGSGKSTTLYAALQHINDPKVNITTIEDPVEYNLTGINQTQAKPEIGVTFAAALRSILRQDPNIIMVGEIRDSETAEIAIRAALTGHLVFSTLHTNDAPSAVTRLIDMGVEPFLVASSVKMILAQRLLRKLCIKCKAPNTPTLKERKDYKLDLSESEYSFCRPVGCPSCNNTGYKGRMAVYEILSVDGAFSDLVARNASSSDLRQSAQASGMRTLWESAMKKAMRGETSLEEVLRETAV
jgi:type IV pilus assembly protein PilB